MSSSKIRKNRRKQDISSLSAEPEFPRPLSKGQWAVPSSSSSSTAAEFGTFMEDDDELFFRGFSYTCDTGTKGDGKSMLDVFACQKCPAIFNSRIGLTNHGKLHGARLPLCCDHCDFSCTNDKTLRYHRRAHGFLPRRRRPSSLKNAEPKKMKAEPSISVKEEEKILISADSTKDAAADEQRSSTVAAAGDDGYYGAVGESADVEQFGDKPPMLARATLNSAGLEEEDDEEEDWEVKEEEMEAEEKGKSAQQMHPIASSSLAPPTTSRRTRKTTKEANELRTNAVVETVGSRRRQQQQQKKRGVTFGTVRCAKCPFSTPSRVRLQSHMDGHNRSNGFVCSVCEYKHESVGWLHMHCTLHLRKEGVSFQWPPIYAKGAPQGQEDRKEEEDDNEEEQQRGEDDEQRRQIRL